MSPFFSTTATFVCSVLCVVQAAHAQSKKNVSDTSGLGSLSGTLPADVYRVRLLHQSLFGSRGFTEESLSQSPGIDVGVQGMGLIFDMPLFSNNVTLGIGVPFVYSNHASFNREKFTTSNVFDKSYKKARDAFIGRLVAIGECATADICKMRIERGDSIPVDVKFNIPDTNELYVLPAHTPIQQGLTGLVSNGAQQGNGATGLGDIEAAVRYRWLTFDQTRNLLQSAAQFGIKLPTGAYTNVPQAQRAIGRGVFELELGAMGDAMLLPLLSLSGSYNASVAVGSGSKGTSGVIDNTKIADGGCDVAGQGNNSDGSCVAIDTKKTVTRRGLRHEFLVQANLGLGLFDRTLNPFGLSFGIVHDIDSIEVIGGEAQPGASQTSIRTTFNFMGPAVTSALVPIEVNVEYTYPFAGKNKTIATQVLAVTTALYWK